MSNRDIIIVAAAYKAYRQFSETNNIEYVKEMRKNIGELSEDFQAENDFYDWVAFYLKTNSNAVLVDMIEEAGCALNKVRNAR